MLAGCLGDLNPLAHDFHRHESLQVRVPRSVDHTHATCPKRSDDLGDTNASSVGKRHRSAGSILSFQWRGAADPCHPEGKFAVRTSKSTSLRFAPGMTPSGS